MGWTGMIRVAGLYFAGVGMGCLGASVAEPTKYLLGASAGVYALIFAHLGENSFEMISCFHVRPVERQNNTYSNPGFELERGWDGIRRADEEEFRGSG